MSEPLVPASPQRLLLAVYLDFVIFSVPWTLVEHFVFRPDPDWQRLATPAKFILFSMLEALLHFAVRWSPGRWLLGIRARGVPQSILSRESWFTILVAVLVLLEGTKGLVRWSMWTPPTPLFGIVPSHEAWPWIAMACGAVECLIAGLIFQLRPAALYAGITYFGVMLWSAVSSSSMWDAWIAENVIRRRAYQGLPVRPDEITQMQAITPAVIFAGLVFYLAVVAIAGAIIVRRSNVLRAASAAILVILLSAAAPAASRVVVIQDVTIIDGSGSPPQAGMTVVVNGDRIRTIGKTARVRVPKGAEVIPASRKFLIPGLWDMHVHLGGEELDKSANLPLFIANGVTGIRIMDGLPEHRRWRGDVEAGRLAGPRMLIASAVIGFSPTDVTEALEAARRAKREGADFLKIHDNLSRAAYFALVDESRMLGLKIAGHVPASVTAEEAARAGQTSIEHLTGLAAAKDAEINVLKRHRTWQCPTLMMRRNYARLDDQAMAHDPRLIYVKPSWSKRWRRMSEEALAWPADEGPKRKETIRKEFALVARMNRAGVGILAGTDDGNPYSFPGFGLHDELEALVDAGLTPMQALQAATRNPARFLGKSRTLGTVEQGKIADLVLLNANPLVNIRNTRDIELVVVAGRVFPRAALDALLKTARALAQN